VPGGIVFSPLSVPISLIGVIRQGVFNQKSQQMTKNAKKCEKTAKNVHFAN
jgi:hypothetical protein